jgi:hypothetical protein
LSVLCRQICQRKAEQTVPPRKKWAIDHPLSAALAA